RRRRSSGGRGLDRSPLARRARARRVRRALRVFGVARTTPRAPADAPAAQFCGGDPGSLAAALSSAAAVHTHTDTSNL
ncbi:jg18834, partial [Pararge aegeria aegeria]